MDAFARRWLVFLLYLWNLALDPNSQGCFYLEDGFGRVVALFVVFAKCPAISRNRLSDRWVCHACGHWSLPTHLASKEVACWAMTLRDVIQHCYCLWENEVLQLLTCQSLRLSSIALISLHVIDVEIPLLPVKTHARVRTHTHTVTLSHCLKAEIFRTLKGEWRVVNIVHLIIASLLIWGA